jgi:hypothetical protein
MKIRLPVHTFSCAAWMFAAMALSFSLHGQDVKTFHIRLLDGKTGQPVKADNFLVRIDRHETVHNEWVKIDDDGSVTVTVPNDAKEIAVKATYDMSTEKYINCETAKESDKERDTWYPIADILKTGVIAANECSKTNYSAKPGEFVFFVRKRGWRDFPND